MKIFVYIGSNKGDKSNTYSTIRAIINKIEDKLKSKVDVDYYIASEINVNECKGCNNCFNKGQCITDKIDDMSILKKSMELADVIIWGTPVYLHNVSGSTKKFLDRLSDWIYIFKLSGKIGVSVTTSNTNGNNFVDTYLSRVMNIFGLFVAYSVSLKIALMTEEDIDKEINECANNVIAAYLDKSTIKSTALQEEFFKTYKNVFSTPNCSLPQSIEWKEKKYYSFETYDQLLKNKINDNNKL